MAGAMGSFRSDTTRVIMPLMPAHAYKTYGIAMPLATHWRPASCDEYGCEAYRLGWVTTVDLSTDLGQKQAGYIRHDRSRSCREEHAGLTVVRFVYGPGNTCFRFGDHRVPLERPALYLVSGGDWRGNPRGVAQRRHTRADDWVDDFATHQDKIATAIGKG